VDVLSDNQYIERIDFSPNPTNQITALAIYDKSPNVQGLPFTAPRCPVSAM